MGDPGHPFARPPGGLPPWPGPAGAWQPVPPVHPAPATKRRTSRWLTIGLPLGVLLVLGGCGTVAVLAFNAFTGALGPASDAGEAYAAALVDRRWDDAHAMLCEDVRAAVSADQLAARYGSLTGYSVEGVRVASSGGPASGEVTVRFVSEGGLDELTVLPLVREDDAWRPCP